MGVEQTATGPDAGLTGRALRAQLRQELVAPVNAVLGLAELLLGDARERGHDDFVADLERVRGAGQHLLALVGGLLAQPGEMGGAEIGRRVRHELRTPLTHVIGYCELWLEDADERFLAPFVPDLRRLLGLGKRLLARLDDLVGLAGPGEAAPAADGVPEMVRAVAGPLPPAAADRPPEAAGTLLVVDDNETNRDVLCRWLRRDGHAVAAAPDGGLALDLLRSGAFDLILLDVIMPALNGFQVLERLKADGELRHVPVIMISAFDDVDGVARCIERGAEDYLPKPFNPALLKARINASLEKKRLRDREAFYLERIRQEQRRSDELLHVLLPAEVVRELKETNAVRPRRHENVAVLFADIVGFTPFCDRNEPEEVLPPLQRLMEAWEEITLRGGVQKVKTVGDAFMGAAGLLRPGAGSPVLPCVRCGLEMIAAARALGVGWEVRVGVHAGPVVAGVIGRRQYLYDLWGDTVNTAARMESHGEPGTVTLSGTAWSQIAHLARGASLGPVEVKGKGRLEVVRFERFLA
jgi:class 3 adenylate cyclase/CheY-like chemotaxis protein